MSKHLNFDLFNLPKNHQSYNKEFKLITIDVIPGDEPSKTLDDFFNKQFNLTNEIINSNYCISSLNYYYLDGKVTINSVSVNKFPLSLYSKNNKLVGVSNTNQTGYYKFVVDNKLDEYRIIAKDQSRTYNTMIRDYLTVCEKNKNLYNDAVSMLTMTKINQIQKNVNLAFKKPIEQVYSSLDSPERITDSVKDNNYYSYGFSKVVGFIVDLQSIFIINKIILWRYWYDARKYLNTKIEISYDKKIWKTVYDSNIDGIYNETNAGKTITFENYPCRYIRTVTYDGNTVDYSVHYIELEAYYSE